MKGGKVDEVVWTVNGWNEYPPNISRDVEFWEIMVSGDRRPWGLNARPQPVAENSLSGIVMVDKYAAGEARVTRYDVGVHRSELYVFAESLSLQLFAPVGGASGLLGFVRRWPRCEKYPRPRIVVGGEDSRGAQGVGSACEEIVSSMLQSPQGASVV